MGQGIIRNLVGFIHKENITNFAIYFSLKTISFF